MKKLLLPLYILCVMQCTLCARLVDPQGDTTVVEQDGPPDEIEN